MSTLMSPLADTPRAGLGERIRATARRAAALTRAELILLRRNRMAMFMTMAMPVVTAFLFAGLDVGDSAGTSLGATTIMMVASFVMLFVVYYNLVTTYVARREELVLKRLRSGESGDGEIIGGTAVASVVVALVQIVLIAVLAPFLFDLAVPVNPLLVVVGVVLGAVVFVPLAALSANLTRTVEMAQVTTLPVLMICMGFSGFVVPLNVMPDPVASAAEFLPLTPAVELMRIGLEGVTNEATTVDLAGSFAAAAQPVAILAVWVLLGVWAAGRWFRWEPRR